MVLSWFRGKISILIWIWASSPNNVFPSFSQAILTGGFRSEQVFISRVNQTHFNVWSEWICSSSHSAFSWFLSETCLGSHKCGDTTWNRFHLVNFASSCCIQDVCGNISAVKVVMGERRRKKFAVSDVWYACSRRDSLPQPFRFRFSNLELALGQYSTYGSLIGFLNWNSPAHVEWSSFYELKTHMRNVWVVKKGLVDISFSKARRGLEEDAEAGQR